ncbi:hypothetical protein OK349_00130 [Sphingomonas sp. BT-65]|uniref:hypothetical protein n=1 Tax=Sphingomonas sp. BT-65 TaxID=2989821 RepID=UPI0022354361|nr:hypothetical protein [Sphingomonas sp. BT-65]MCW4460101.1 hypothetical protein [Sphingomonas sp. BT-65]
MALNRTDALALGGAALFAVVMPVALLWPGADVKLPARAADTRAVVPPPMPVVAAVYERPLFAAVEASDEIPADAPALVGIAGRLNRDAVALVRLADGSSRSLGVGESVDGWRLESLAIDAAFFTRGRERVRVAMGASDATEDSAAEEPVQ